MRFSKILAEKYDISVRTAKRYIKDGFVSLDGRIIKRDEDYAEGELTLCVNATETDISVESYLIADFGNIVYFDKPVNMHSERHKPDDGITVSDIVTKYHSGFHLISRLDFTTDGIIAAVEDGYEPKEIHKVYLAVVCGNLEKPIQVDFLIDAEKRTHVKIAAEHGGNVTTFTPMEHNDNFTLVRAEFSKASRHQLRACLSHLGYPILGDKAYGGQEFDRIMLHSTEIEIDGVKASSTLTEEFLNNFNKFIL